METVLLSKFFGAIGDISNLIPNFSERRKKELAEETKKLAALENAFNHAAVSFGSGSRSDELLGLADTVNAQDKKLKNLIIIYAKELTA